MLRLLVSPGHDSRFVLEQSSILVQFVCEHPFAIHDLVTPSLSRFCIPSGVEACIFLKVLIYRFAKLFLIGVIPEWSFVP